MPEHAKVEEGQCNGPAEEDGADARRHVGKGIAYDADYGVLEERRVLHKGAAVCVRCEYALAEDGGGKGEA